MKTLFTAACIWVALSWTLSATAQPWAPIERPIAERELIVLLAPPGRAPSPRALVEGVGKGRGLDPEFLAARPESARPALPFRAGDAARERFAADPDSPRALLERYVVIRYPESADLDAIARALAARPDVLHVERNRVGTIAGAALPPFSDPFIPDQWGLAALNLPAAWERTVGRAFVGFVDSGLQVEHPDLRAFPAHVERVIQGDDGQAVEICRYAVGSYEGGNFRPQLSTDLFEGDCNVDERDPPQANNRAGHGSHVAGIVGANAGNGTGVVGACPGCSLMSAKAFQGSLTFSVDRAAAGLTFLVDQGAQVVSMSWQLGDQDCSDAPLAMLCTALDLAESRDVVMSASSGNHKQNVGFPARDGRVLGAGGLEPDGDFWDFQDESGETCPYSGTTECGSNYAIDPGTQQDLVAPAVAVLSTMYEGRIWNDVVGCGDDTYPAVGYGTCTGTSMSSPYVAGVAALVRSVNPLLDWSEVRQALLRNADRANAYHPKFGFGAPDAAASVDAALGEVAGRTLTNRLTPLFSLHSYDAATHLSTTAPQMAGAAIQDPSVHYLGGSAAGQQPGAVPGYPQFTAGCEFLIGCQYPAAWVYLFSGPGEAYPGAPALAPLYRMSYDEPWNGNLKNRSFFYTTEVAGVDRGKQIGYELDGIEGYLYPRCSPEPSCIPDGAVRLYRLYNPQTDDYALFPESQESAFRSAGYVSQSGLNDWIGYVYENVDSDGDTVIDAFESLAGTNPSVADSDCDGLSDGDEMLVFDADGLGYGDPLDGPCRALNVHLADTFAAPNGSLHGRSSEIGGQTWTARRGARVKNGIAFDEVAIGSVPFDLTSVGAHAEVSVSARVDPYASDWVGVGFTDDRPVKEMWKNGQVWLLVRPNRTYQAMAPGAQLASGAIPGSASGGFERVEVRYHRGTRRATYLLNGVQVHSEVLASEPPIRRAGFHMRIGAEGGPKLDDFVIADRSSAVRVALIADTFSSGRELDQRAAETGGVVWAAKPGATRIGSGYVYDASAAAGLALGPELFAGQPTVAVKARVRPFSAWTGLGFAHDAARAYWAIGEIWLRVRPGGSFEAFAGGVSVAGGTIPGTAVNDYHLVEVRYETATRRATFLLNGVEVGSGVLATPPNLTHAGFHVHGGVGFVDDFEVLSTAAP